MNKPINIQSFVCEVDKCPDIQRLKAENDGLKSQLDFEIQKRETVEAKNERLKKEVSDLNFYIDSYRQTWELDKYRKALEEIREITNNFFEECGIPDDYFKRNNYSWKQHQIKALTCKIKQIQDKINEVLKDE